MTDNTINRGEADAGSAAALIDISPDELTDLDDDVSGEPEEPAKIDAGDSDSGGFRGTGAVSGGFGLAGLALAIVSLTTNWTSGIVISHSQYKADVNAGSSGLAVQQELNLYADGWRTQGWWALVFAAAAVLFGAGALLVPRIRRRGTPGWVKATATSAIIVGLIAAILAVLAIVGVFGGHLTAPTSTG
jgi:hypothetical protein